MERLFIDTSGWFAYANRKAPAHEPVRKTMREFPGRIVTSNFILDETLSLCRFIGLAMPPCRLDQCCQIPIALIWFG